MAAYYNEIDPYAAQWLRNLIDSRLVAEGDVDERSIRDVAAADLRGYTQCHFFAGIGVWSYAIRLAGWPDDRPVWTGSCPCQPFSAAGKGAGFADERHLWPEFYRLIAECHPPVVFGEQVASKDGLGWLDTVQSDMEASGYALGAADLCAAGIGAPHIRQRLWFIGERLADTHNDGRSKGQRHDQGARHGDTSSATGNDGGLADACNDGPQGWGSGRSDQGRETLNGSVGRDGATGRPSPTNGHWRDADWLHCRDGKWRPVEPGTFPLAHGASARVGRLRAYGNAIVPQAAAEVIKSYMEIHQ